MTDKNKISSLNLRVGEAMRVTTNESFYYNCILLRTYDGLLDINNPKNTWFSIPDFRGVRVKLEISAIDLID